MSEKKVKIGILTITLIIFLVIFSLMIILKKNNNNSNISKEVSLFEKVDDYSTYFFVQKNINEFLNYLSNEESNNVYNLLSSNYVNEKNITLSNCLYDHDLTNTKTEYSLKITDLKEYNLNDNIFLYLAEGNIYDIGYDSYKKVAFRRYVVLIDYKTRSYQIFPEENNLSDKKIISKLKNINYIENNTYNDVKTISAINQNSICTTYFYDFYSIIQNDQELALEIIENSYTYDDLEEFINNKMSLSILGCDVNDKDAGSKTYKITDSNNNKYTFKENSIMNYTVTLSK